VRRLAIRARAALSTLTLRLADPLDVTSVTSVEYGRLLHLRVKNQNTIMVSLPRQLPQDSDITLILNYEGRVAPDPIETETLQPGQDQPSSPGDNPFSNHEPHYLLSNRSLWYPQNPVPDYATATIRLVVPEGYGCVASGEPGEERHGRLASRSAHAAGRQAVRVPRESAAAVSGVRREPVRSRPRENDRDIG
jgi:hypothetical protein